MLSMEEHAMATGTCDVTHDGGMGEAEDASNLAQAWTFVGEAGDLQEGVPALEPVVGGEGSGGETTGAARAAEALELASVGGATEEAVAGGSPIGIEGVMRASGVGAVGRSEVGLE